MSIEHVLQSEKTRSIPRADVADVCIQSLLQPGALKRSLDIITREPGSGTLVTDWKAFFQAPINCKY